MDITHEVLSIIDDVLSLQGRTAGFTPDTRLLGAIPELDSMAVVALITALEERFEFVVEDDEITSSIFETVGSMADFVESKLAS